MPSIDVPQELCTRIDGLVEAKRRNVHDLPPSVPDPAPAMAATAPGSHSVVDVLEAAVTLLEVHWTRDENDVAAVPEYPFQKIYSDRPADPLLRQRSAKEFDLEEPFVYRGKVAHDAAEATTWAIAEKPERTDFASIPGFLTWLIPRYGRHTMAALVHDHLQDLLTDDADAPPLPTGEQPVTSAQADYVMREAMRSSGVPFVQRWIIWSGIAVRTLVTKPFDLRFGALAALWIALYGVGVGVVGLGWLLTIPVVRATGGSTWSPAVWMAALVLSPFVLSVLWGLRRSRWTTGVVAGFTLMVVALPVVVITLARSVYLGAELIAKLRPKHTIVVDDRTLVTLAHNPIFEANWTPHAADCVRSATPLESAPAAAART